MLQLLLGALAEMSRDINSMMLEQLTWMFLQNFNLGIISVLDDQKIGPMNNSILFNNDGDGPSPWMSIIILSHS